MPETYKEIKWELNANSIDFEWGLYPIPIKDRKILQSYFFYACKIDAFKDITENKNILYITIGILPRIKINCKKYSNNDIINIFNKRFKKI